jgi:cardiolipin synthase
VTTPVSLAQTLRRAGLAVAACLLTASCASLPDIRYLDPSLTKPAAPVIVNGKGKLSAQRASSLLAKRYRSSDVETKAMAAQEEAATGSPLIAGNKITLLYDGPQTMAAMLDAIANAKDHINLETYIFEQDEIGLRFADLLIAKQTAGVKVNIIYDSVGTIGTPQAFFDRMRAAGIQLLAFNPVNPLKAKEGWNVNQRDHRKILIVDGLTAFTGGVNISATYSSGSSFRARGSSDTRSGWRDTHIRIEGPAVAVLQWTFLRNWSANHDGDLPDGQFFPPLKEVGDKLVRVLASEPGNDFDIYKAYVLAMREAKTSIHITCAYFVPDAQVLKALTEAARRGVDVRIVLPGVTDSGLVFHAGQSFYDDMLASGIKIYQLQDVVLHAKTAVIDSVWSTVGSTNLDTRSFLHNSELNVIVFGGEFGTAMEAAFAEDLRNSKEITKEDWARRPLADRLKEITARMMEYWL